MFDFFNLKISFFNKFYIFKQAIGLDFDATPILGNVRSKRYTAVIENNIVKKLFEGKLIKFFNSIYRF